MAYIPGTSGADELLGTEFSDKIEGFAGADTITGGSGDDSMYGGTGDDVFRIGGTSIGNDIYNGGDGADSVRLSADVETSYLSLRSARVIGVEQLDFSYYSISGTGEADSIDISGFTNVRNYNTIDLYDGNDKFIGYSGSDDVDGGVGDDRLDGGAGADYLTGGGGNDNLIGGSGDDTFYVGGSDVGSDVYNGGSGADRVRLTSDLVTSRFSLTDNLVGTETLDLSYYSIRGTGGNDVLNISGVTYVRNYGRIDLEDGNDHFTGFAGDDNVNGDSGNDTLHGGAGDDTLTGGTGDDYLGGGSGDDVFLLGSTAPGNDRYDGGAGSGDEIRLTADLSTRSLNFSSTSTVNVETLNMSYYDINGTSSSDTFNFSGIKTVRNNETIYLYDGNDLFRGHQESDFVQGGGGNDTLQGISGNDKLGGNDGDDRIDGGGGNDNLTGGAGADRFYFGVSTGSDFIGDWTNGPDKLYIDSAVYGGVNYDRYSDLSISQVGSDTVIRFAASQIVLDNTQRGTVDASDFVFF